MLVIPKFRILCQVYCHKIEAQPKLYKEFQPTLTYKALFSPPPPKEKKELIVLIFSTVTKLKLGAVNVLMTFFFSQWSKDCLGLCAR